MAIVVVSAVYFWQARVGFSLWDEGFLWYGARQVMSGEVPIRDFMAYEPGRYYWSAAVMAILGDDGILALRIAIAAFQAVGLFFFLLLVSDGGRQKNLAFLIVSAIVGVAWMLPRHKIFDISLCIFLVAALAYWARHLDFRGYFLAGLCVGLVAAFGRNHGVYGLFASLGVIAWIYISKPPGTPLARGIAFWSAGVVSGFAPILAMVIFVPGFASAFWENIMFLFELKSTNIPLPVPWPWHISFHTQPLGDSLRAFLVGVFFVALVLFGILSLGWVASRTRNGKPVPPTLFGTSFLALPYAHFAYSRADFGHLAQGVFPLLIGCLTVLA